MLTELFNETQTIQFGQHEVDNRGIIGLAQGQMQSVLAIGGMIHGKAGLFQPLNDKGSDLSVIFHHQQPHG